MKRCSKCGLQKSEADFKPNRRGTQCLECLKEMNRKWYIRNRQRCLKRTREYSKANKGVYRKAALKYYYKNKEKCRLRNRAWIQNHMEHIKRKMRLRRQTDVCFRIKTDIRAAIHRGLSMVGKRKTHRSIQYLGCTLERLKAYLESLFKPGMTWDNLCKFGWHIDHCFPLAWFDLRQRQQREAAFHYTNLQPLWAAENWSKGARHL